MPCVFLVWRVVLLPLLLTACLLFFRRRRALDWENRGFTGGETMILKPHVLDYWRSFQPGVGLEERHFIDTVEPHFNRLTVFDPRFPHGVRPVAGTRDPLKGRLVSR